MLKKNNGYDIFDLSYNTKIFFASHMSKEKKKNGSYRINNVVFDIIIV